MTVYLTKVWGFEEPCGPLQFGLKGWRDRARKLLQDGDLVVLVGTQGDETAKDERGRLLGIMEPTREIVRSLDFDVRQSSTDFNEAGEYKWPFALLNRKAWILEERPLLSEITDRRFGMDSAQGIVPFTEDEAEEVLSLKSREIDLLLPVRAWARIVGADAAGRRGAPPPTTTRKGVMHLRRAPAYTYCMELIGAKHVSHKIGWAFDFKARERQFNQTALPGIGGIRYRTKLNHLSNTAMDAFRMEQALLAHFDQVRHPSNREVLHGVSYREIESAWVNFLHKGRVG